MVPKTSGVYKITCTANGNYYYGCSTNLRKRWNEHKSHLRKNKHANPPMQLAWNRQGESAFTFEVIQLLPIKQLTEIESSYLREHIGKPDCFNIQHPDVEVNRLRLSQIFLEKFSGPEGETYRQKLSESHTFSQARLDAVRRVGLEKRSDYCGKGHPMSGDNLYVGPDGHRECRVCKNLRQRKYIKAHMVPAQYPFGLDRV